MAKAKAKKKTVVKAKAKKAVVKAKPAAKPQAKKAAKPAAKAKAKPAAKAAIKKSVAKAKSALVKAQAKKTPMDKKAVNFPAPVKTKLVDVSEFVTPLDDRMIVQVLEGEKVTAGGIIIPDTITGVVANRRGVVLSVGRGHRDPKGRVRPMDVQKGDKIVFPDFTGSKINYQGQDLIILRETDVMGVLD